MISSAYDLQYKPAPRAVGECPSVATSLPTVHHPRAALVFLDYSDLYLPLRQCGLLARAPTLVQLIARRQSGRGHPLHQGLVSNGTTFVMDDSCLDPRLYDIEGKGFKLKRFTGSSNLNDIVPAMVKQESDMTLLDVPDVLIAMEKRSGSIKVLGPISEEQRMAAPAFVKTSPEPGRHSMNFRGHRRTAPACAW